jgi:nicotinamidase-related amidase
MNQALLIIDVQNDYFPGGAMELVRSVQALEKIRSVIRKARMRRIPVIHIQHVAIREDATFFIRGTPGAEIHEGIAPEDGEIVLVKNYPNSFRGTNLHEVCRERNIDSLAIVGMMTHMCVDTTVRAAFDLGFKCTLIEDCCATHDLKFNGNVVPAADVHASFIAALNGIFATVIQEGQYLAG